MTISSVKTPLVDPLTWTRLQSPLRSSKILNKTCMKKNQHSNLKVYWNWNQPAIFKCVAAAAVPRYTNATNSFTKIWTCFSWIIRTKWKLLEYRKLPKQCNRESKIRILCKQKCQQANSKWYKNTLTDFTKHLIIHVYVSIKVKKPTLKLINIKFKKW